MAQTGYTPISLYYTTTAAAVPVNTNLVNGELAINITDGKLYYKNNSGVVTLLAGATSGPAGGSNTQVQYNSSGVLAGSSALTWDGTTLAATKFSGALNGTVGATTPSTGAFTTLSSTLDATIYGLTVGRGAGAVSTNTAVGSSALNANTTASNNTAVGYQAGYSNSTATGNSFFGQQAGYSATTSGYNTVIGQGAGYSLTTGAFAWNVLVGSSAGRLLTTGVGNTFVGGNSTAQLGAGFYVTTGSANVILGGYSGSAAPISATGSNYVVLSDGDGNIVASSKTAQTFALQGGTLSAGTGIAFPATQSASTDANTLDDYEEGTWTPTFVSLTVVNGTGGATYSGTYTKIGRVVFWTATITVTGTCTTASVAGTTNISNLPFQVLGSNSFLTACDGTPNSLGVGQNQGGSLVAYIPTWTARNAQIFLSGQYNY